MFKQLPPLKSLRAFEAAARHASFTEAANELAVTQGAISYQIKVLEEKLEIKLFHRHVRQVILTTEGEKLFKTVHRLFTELQDETLEITSGKQSMILTISMSTFFASRWLSKRLANFLNKHPEVTIRLQHSVNDPGFDVEDVDMAIKWGRGDWEYLESELLLESPMFMFCAPSLANSDKPIHQLEDLREHVFLHDLKGNDGWQEWLTKAGLEDLGEGTGPLITDSNVRVQAAIDGNGLLLGNYLLKDELDNNLLITPFDIQLNGLGFHLCYSNKVRKRKAFQLFRQWLLDEAKNHPCTINKN